MPNSPQALQQALEQMHDELSAQVGAGHVPGLVTGVICGEEVDVFAVGTLGVDNPAPMRAGSIFRIASVAKPITAFAALRMIEEGLFGLDEPVTRLLPELARPRVLRNLEGPVPDTVPALREITVRDLLTFTAGYGIVMAAPGTYPIQAGLAAAIGEPGPPQPARSPAPDEYLAALAGLPLLHQPGQEWTYNTCSDLLGVLMARAAGTSLEKALRVRIFGPLGMADSGFSVPPGKIGRLTTSYRPDADGGLELYDPAEGGQWAAPPPFESAAGGLVSTVTDLLAFSRLMLGRGVLNGKRLLSEELFTAMTSDQLTPQQKAATTWIPGFFDHHGWGFGLAVRTVAGDGESAGSFGWSGGLGTAWACDPVRGSAGILLTQRAMTSPSPEELATAFWRGVHAAGSAQG